MNSPHSRPASRGRTILFVSLILTAVALAAALVETVSSVPSSSLAVEKAAAPVPDAGRASRSVEPVASSVGKGADSPLLAEARLRLGDAGRLSLLKVRRGRTVDRVTARFAIEGVPTYPERVQVLQFDKRGRFVRRSSLLWPGERELQRARGGDFREADWEGNGRKSTAWRGRATRVWWWPRGGLEPKPAWRTIESGKVVISEARTGRVLARRPAGSLREGRAKP